MLQPRQPTEAVYRSQEDNWLTSQLPDDLPLPRDAFILRWAAGPPGTTYDVTITDEDLEALAGATRLSVTEYEIAAAARKLPEDHPAYQHFEWDVEKAARICWRMQSRQLVASIRTVRKNAARRMDEIRAFHSIMVPRGEHRGRAYVTIDEIASDKEAQFQLAAEAHRDLEVWSDRYKSLRRFFPVAFKKIEEAAGEILEAESNG